MNMILIGDGHCGIKQQNSLKNLIDGDKNGKGYDVVITNMPYSQKTEYGSYYDLPSNNGDSICVQHCIKAVDKSSENGRMAIVVPEGFLFRKDMEKTRKYLLNRCYLKSIISLPQGVFLPYTGVKTNILYCTDVKKKKKQEKFWYFDVKNDGYTLDNHRRKIEGENDLQKFLSYRNINAQEKREILSVGFSEISIEEIKENNLILVGSRYKKFINYDNIKWETVPLSDVAKIGAGNSAPQDQKLFKDGKYPFFRVSDVAKYHITNNLIESNDKLNEKGIKGLKESPKNTILFPKSGASTFLNHRALLGIKGYVSSHLATIEPYEDKILPKYLFYLLCGIDAKNLTIDQNYPSLKLAELSNLKIPLPSIEKQQEIINELESYQKIIDGAKQIITSYQVKIPVNEDWEISSIKDCIVQIRTAKKKIKKQDYLDNGRFPIISQDSDKLISGYTNENKGMVKDLPIIVFGDHTKVLKYIDFPFFCGADGVKLIKPDKRFVEKYFYYALKSLKVIELSQKYTRHYQYFIKQQIPIPSLNEQKKIIDEIEKEEGIIKANQEAIIIFEKKIQEKLNLIWGK